VRGLVLFAHGASDPQWAKPFEAIRDRVRDALPGRPVALAYLESMAPTLEEAVDALTRQGATHIVVIPLFMSQGAHLKRDVPRIIDAIRAGEAGVEITVENAIGDVPEILDVIASWVVSKLHEAPGER